MSKGRILIVDDDPIVRDVLANILTGVGQYVVDEAVDGQEGIEKIRMNEYDAVFTDITMPNINGIDLLKETRLLHPSLPVVVITGFSTMENAVNAMREGAKDFITKPFSVGTITSIAERIIGEKNLLQKVSTDRNYESFISRLNADLFKRLQEIGILQSISTELDNLYDNKDIYVRIVEMASRLLMVKEASFGIIQGGTLLLKGVNGVQQADISLLDTVFERASCSKGYDLATVGECNPFTGNQLQAPLLSIPLSINGEAFGILSLGNKADGTTFTQDEISLALTFARKAAQRIENNALYDVLYNNLVNTLKALVITIEARDFYTRQHSERVTSYASAIAEVMGLSAEDQDAIRFGGYLHDVGKIGVRDTVLLKPGKLTDEELSEIRQHPVIGGNIVKPLRFFPKERDVIVHHHERFDGAGYPSGLSGQAIPITARILAVADTYDAMTSSRPYRKSRTHADALDELVRCSDTQFDREAVRAFRHVQTKRDTDPPSGDT